MVLKKQGKHADKKLDAKLKKVIILKILLILFLIILIHSSIEIIKWYINNNQNLNLKEELSSLVTINIISKEEQIEDEYKIDFNSLKEMNQDAVAFLKVNGTNIEYFVVQGNDNQYYLNHSFDKSYNKAGWIFADYRNKLDGTDKNLIIYGHNRRNNSMFGTLENILKEEWYNNEKNRQIIFVTENESYTYETFSVYKIEVEDEYIQTKFSERAYVNFLTMIKSRSVVDFGIDVTSDDNILTLSTCADDSKYRIVLHAKRLNNES